MNKSILIIDTPKNCAECRLVDYWKRVQEYHCRYLDNRYLKEYDEKPIDCPLKPVPQKKDLIEIEKSFIQNKVSIVKLYNASGYNACIDEILGEEND